MEVTDQSGHGLKVSAVSRAFEASVLPYSQYQLEDAKHQEELSNPQYTWLRVFAGQMGVGGDDSWGAPVHEEFWLKADQPLDLTFAIKAI